MLRHIAILTALAAVLFVASAARAQDDKKPEEELDPKTKAAVERAVEKAKEDVRNEVRAEIQGAQSAAEFLGAVAEGPELGCEPDPDRQRPDDLSTPLSFPNTSSVWN